MSGTAIIGRDLPAGSAQVTGHAVRPSEVFAWCATVVGTTGILLTSLIGPAGAYMFAALWIAFACRYGAASLGALKAKPVIWLFPGLALVSILWSAAPGTTLRFALEYAITAAAGVLASRMLPARRLITAMICSLLFTAILSIAVGHTSVDPLTGSSAFVGVFDSKNELGFFSSLMLLTSVALVLDRGQPMIFRLIGFAALGIEAPLLVITHSGTSVVTAILAVAVLLANVALSRIGPIHRARVLFALGVCLLPLLAVIGSAGDTLRDFITGTLGKDVTLTGRTVLWQRAAVLIPDHPLLGVGFQAFWRADTVDAESLWHEFHVLGRTGFHFHSTWVETTVELGFAGCIVLAALVVSTLMRCVRWSWRDGSVSASFAVAVMLCLIVRSFVEVDVLFAFQIGSFLLFVVTGQGSLPPAAPQRA